MVSAVNSVSRQRGFTLIELMITLSIAIVIMTVAVPNFQNYIEQNRVKTGAQALFSSLVYARSEALKRNSSVYIYPHGSDWSDGWAVTFEQNNTDCASDSTNCLRVQQALSDVAVTTSASQVVYRGTGEVETTASFDICNAEGSSYILKQQVAVDLTGRPNIEQQGNC